MAMWFLRQARGLTAAVTAAAAIAASASAQAAERGYYRWPAQQGDTLVFASEGDLWRTGAEGGPAARLTSHVEQELAPAISPDGTLLAFTGSYDGPQEVYVMPLAGGAPKQLTFEGGGTLVRGWAPGGKVMFTSDNHPGPWNTVLRLVDPDDLSVETLPLLDANLATFSGDGQDLFFTRHGLSMSNDNAKLYRGGRMSQLWRYRMGSETEAERLAADFGAPIRHPMWWENRIYFLSDKDGHDNIWSVDETGGDPRQHTSFEDWQLKTPRMNGGAILFQRGADLYRYDVAAETETQIDLTLVSDRDYERVRWLEAPLNFVEDSRMGAEGKSVALTARGNIAVTFPGPRRRVELALPDVARARSAIVGPKGEWVYAVIDQDSFGEVWRFPADGRGEGEQLTRDSDTHIWSIYPSPDGRFLLIEDKKARLWSFNIETGAKTLLETNESGNDDAFGGFTWSEDGRYAAYHADDRRSIPRIVIRDIEAGTRVVVTGGKYSSYNPAFSSDGAWLYFLSDRNFEPTPSSPWGDRNLGPNFDKRTKVYALRLDPDAVFPFTPRDELTPAPESDDQDSEEEKEEDTEEDGPAGLGGLVQRLRNIFTGDGGEENVSAEDGLAFEGSRGRLWEVPVASGNYSALGANEKYLYVLDRSPDGTELKSIKIDERDPEIKSFAKDVRSYALSADGETLFYRAGSGPGVTMALVPANATAPDDLSPHRLRAGDWRLEINPAAEWRQMLLDAWRMHRDFAYDPSLRGLDWDAVRDKYLPFVDRLGHRSELNDLLAQMVSELGILHSQIRAGDQPDDTEGGALAFLGAELRAGSAGLEITRIYQGEQALPDTLGPLLKPGVDVQEGDVLTAVDGRPVRTSQDLAQALSHKAGQQVRLDLTRGGTGLSAIVEPVSAFGQTQLRYRHWVQSNRDYVRQATEDRIGYLHMRAMGGRDIASFARDFYEHFDKDGIIIDVRGNFGGNIDSWVIGTLLRQAWAFWQSPLGGEPYTNMHQAFRGHLAVLIDEGTYSDGETFSAGVKALELAPLIGTQTSGAGIWLSGRNPLSDGGMARIAEFPQYGLDGRWLIEGRGVSPDIEVIDLPRESFLGADPQLEAAIENIEGRLETDPIPDLQAKPLPPVGVPGEDVP